LIVLALTAALVGPYFIDWSSYRADFEREASALIGRPVTVRGAADIRLLPFPSVTFSDVQVGGAAGEPTMTVETFSMDAELAPLLRGEFLIFDMRIERPTASLTIGADGSVDWAMHPTAPVDGAQVALESITVTDGVLTVHSAASGRTLRFEDVDLAMSARSLVGPWRVDGTMDVDGRPTTVSASTGVAAADGTMRLRTRLVPDYPAVVVETDGNLRGDSGLSYGGTFRLFENVPPVTDGKGDRRAGQAPTYRLSGDFDLAAAALAVPRFRLETGASEEPFTADGQARINLGASPRFEIQATGAQVRFDDATGLDGAQGLTLEERLAAVRRVLAQVPRPTIPGTIAVDLPAILVGDTTFRDVRLSAEPIDAGWRVAKATATLPGRTTLEVDGVLRTGSDFGFQGNMLLAVRQPSGFAAWLARDIDDAIRRLPSAGFSARVDVGERRQTFRDLELVLGAARFRGEIDSRQVDGLRPTVFLKLDGDALDVDGLTAFGSIFVSDEGRNRFAASDLDFQLTAGPVTVAGITAGTVDTALRLRADGLEIDRLTVGGLAGATIAATGSVRGFPAAPTGNLDASVTAQDLAPLVRLAAERFPGNLVLDGLASRVGGFADLATDARLDIVATSGQGTLAATLAGEAGGSTLTGRFSTDAPASIATSEVSLELDATNEDATALLALAGMRALPIGLLGPGQLTLRAKGRPVDGLDVTTSLSGEGFSAGFDGVLRGADQQIAADGKASLMAEDVEPLVMTTGMAMPGLGLGTPFEAEADLSLRNGVAQFSDLKGAVNELALFGDVALRLEAGRPHLSGALTLDALALDPLAAIVFGQDAIQPAPSGWSQTPFVLDPALPFTLDTQVAAATLTAGGQTAYDAKLHLTLDGDGLRLEEIEATYLDGRAKGRVDLRNTAGEGLLAAQVSVEGADVSAVAGPDLTGKVDVSAELSGNGKSVAALVASLAGSGRAATTGVTINGLNASALDAIIAQADAVGRDIDAAKVAGFAPQMVRDGSFPSGAAEVAFSVAEGVVRAPPVTLTAPEASITADLRADLEAETLSAAGTLVFVPGEHEVAGAEPAVRFAVDAGGLTLDTAPLAQFLTQRALEKEQARVEAMQAELLERQRLRREVRYYAAVQAERDRLAEEIRRAEEAARQAEEERRRAEAAAAEAQEAEQKAEEARRAEEEALRLEQERLEREGADGGPARDDGADASGAIPAAPQQRLSGEEAARAALEAERSLDGTPGLQESVRDQPGSARRAPVRREPPAPVAPQAVQQERSPFLMRRFLDSITGN
jgi:uncharacterized protein involved in outer membrane biogenesis